jgi:cbb3-type cytochrome oxidase maturation protein
MESLYLLIPLSVLLVFFIGVIFWWSVKGGQFDDMEGPGWQIIQDDDKEIECKTSNQDRKNKEFNANEV